MAKFSSLGSARRENWVISTNSEGLQIQTDRDTIIPMSQSQQFQAVVPYYVYGQRGHPICGLLHDCINSYDCSNADAGSHPRNMFTV